MDQARLNRYRQELEAELARLLGNSDEAVEQLESGSVSHADPNDRASLESDRNFGLRLRDRDRRLIGKIREALQRLDENTFGVCRDCGHEIEAKRLDARPVTDQCIECKEDEERRERRGRSEAAETAPSPAPARRRS